MSAVEAELNWLGGKAEVAFVVGADNSSVPQVVDLVLELR